MHSKIPLAKPLLGGEEFVEVRRVLESGWITQGPEVAAFEREFAAFTGAPHACAVANGTAALHLALLAVGVSPGDEVITVSHSFIATGNAIRYCGATPVFVDIKADGSYNLDPAELGRAISERTAAVLCVHQLGMPCDLAAILPLARQYSLPVVEDAACAIGSEIRCLDEWARIGQPHGDIACFSFHPRKVLTTGDGGMLTTRHEEFDRKFRLWRQHGMSISDLQRHATEGVIFEAYTDLGFNYRLTDIQAAIGRVQLRRIPSLVAERRTMAARYLELLRATPCLGAPAEEPWARSNWQSFAVTIPETSDQRGVMEFMSGCGIATRRGVMCMHREPAYPVGTWRSPNDDFLLGERRLKNSEWAQDNAVLLPLYPGLSDAEQCRVIESLAAAVENGSPRSLC